MKAGFHAPLPPARTGVADYASSLLGALRRLGDVQDDAQQADIRLYHIGNNQLHAAIHDRCLREAGVVVLHDAVLHHFYLGQLDRMAYVAEFAYNYGLWTVDCAEGLWKTRARSGGDPRYFAYPMLRRVAERALAVVVHNPEAAALVRAHASFVDIVEIPHLFEMPALPTPDEIVRTRADLGAGPATHVFAVFGHLRESKRLPAILRAFARIRTSVDCRLLIAGEFASGDLERTLAPALRGEGVVRRPYAPEADFWRLAASVDSVINLRYPAAGETSGIAVRLMGIGKPLLLSAQREIARIPEGACICIDHGPAEEDMLAESMLWLARNPDAGRAIGRAAAAHIAAEHSLDRVAARYWEVLAGCYHK